MCVASLPVLLLPCSGVPPPPYIKGGAQSVCRCTPPLKYYMMSGCQFPNVSFPSFTSIMMVLSLDTSPARMRRDRSLST